MSDLSVVVRESAVVTFRHFWGWRGVVCGLFGVFFFQVAERLVGLSFGQALAMFGLAMLWDLVGDVTGG